VKPAVALSVTEFPEQIVVEPTGVIESACGVFTVMVVVEDAEGQPFEPVAVTL
jgi:hypothetical protein